MDSVANGIQACTLLTEIVIPKGVTSLGEYTFSSCSQLTDITLPAGLTAIGRNVFANTALTDVWYAGTEASWNRIVMDAGNDPLLQATVHYNVLPFTRVLRLPEGLTVLGSEAFANVQKPEAVILPDSLIAIAKDAIDPDVVLVISADSEWFTWAEAHGYTVYAR